MMQVLDAWATWRYGLGDVHDDKSAWEAFERVCERADLYESYAASSVDGRAVELLIDRLDPERLVKQAERIIRACGIRFTPDEIVYSFRYGPYTDESTNTDRVRDARLPASADTIAHATTRSPTSLNGR
jgi:hypothetical protein